MFTSSDKVYLIVTKLSDSFYVSYVFFHLTACNSWRRRWRNCWWNIRWKWLKGKSQYKCFYLIFIFWNLHTLPSLFLPDNSSVYLHLIDKKSANLNEIYFFMYICIWFLVTTTIFCFYVPNFH